MKTYHAQYNRATQTAKLTDTTLGHVRKSQTFQGTEKQFIAACFQCKLKGVPVKIDIT